MCNVNLSDEHWNKIYDLLGMQKKFTLVAKRPVGDL